MKQQRIITVTLMLLSALIAITMQGFGQEAQTKECYAAEQKVFCSATAEDNFAGGSVIVTLTQAATRRFLSYMPQDFPEIDCIAVEDLTSDVVKSVQMRMNTKNYQDQSLVNTDAFRRILMLKLRNGSKEHVLKTIKILQEKRSDIRSAEPNYIMTKASSASESYPAAGAQWALPMIQATEAWGITTGASDVMIGILDSGIDADHPDLRDRIDRALSENFVDDNEDGVVDENDISALTDPSEHGTHVAGIIGGQNSNGSVSGVCRNISLVSLRIATKNNQFENYWLLRAIHYANTKGISILNFSGGYDDWNNIITENISLKTALASYMGLFVCSSGNGVKNNLDDYVGKDNDMFPYYPSQFTKENPRVLSVGAVARSGNIRKSSNYGLTSVDIFAPGEEILSTLPGGGYGYKSGTSMAAAFVSGTAALLLSAYPHLSPEAVKAAILSGAAGRDGLIGIGCVSGGILNAYDALQAVLPTAGLSYTLNEMRELRVSAGEAAGESMVVIPATHNGIPVTEIAENGFRNCTGLTNVVFLGSNLQTIGRYAFGGCTNLMQIRMPGSVTAIGAGAFQDCRKLLQITVPSSVETIGASAFKGCWRLKDIIFPSGGNALRIGMHAFAGCSGLNVVTLPSRVESIGNYAFYGCNSLSSIYLENAPVAELDMGVYTYYEVFPDALTQIFVPGNALEAYRQNIGWSAYLARLHPYTPGLCYRFLTPFEKGQIKVLQGGRDSAAIYIPALYKGHPVTTIDVQGFQDCIYLREIVIPDSITQIGSEAFRSCRYLEHVIWGSDPSIDFISAQAFADCSSLAEIRLPASITEIYPNAFQGCDNLTIVYVESAAPNVMQIKNNIFAGCPLAYITVPDEGSVTAYRAASYWNMHASKICRASAANLQFLPNTAATYSVVVYGDPAALSGVVVIPAYYGGGKVVAITNLENCPNMTRVVLPETVVRIGERAFAGCGNLAAVRMPRSMREIRAYAFAHCARLTRIEIPNASASVAGNAFDGSGITETMRWTGVRSYGIVGMSDTFRFALTFEGEPSALRIEHVTVAGADKGTLSGNGRTRTLTVRSVQAGTVVRLSMRAPEGTALIGNAHNAYLDSLHSDDAQAAIGVLLPSGADTYVQAVYALEAMARMQGVGLAVRNAEGCGNRQALQAEELVRKGVEVIVVWPMEREALLPVLAMAREAGIYVIELGEGEGGASLADCILAMDHYWMGYAQGLYFLEHPALGNTPERMEVFVSGHELHTPSLQAFLAGAGAEQALCDAGAQTMLYVHAAESPDAANRLLEDLYEAETIEAMICFADAFVPWVAETVEERDMEVVVTAVSYDYLALEYIAWEMLDAVWYMDQSYVVGKILELAERLRAGDAIENQYELLFVRVDADNLYDYFIL